MLAGQCGELPFSGKALDDDAAVLAETAGASVVGPASAWPPDVPEAASPASEAGCSSVASR
jgi:hypothetical protein